MERGDRVRRQAVCHGQLKSALNGCCQITGAERLFSAESLMTMDGDGMSGR